MFRYLRIQHLKVLKDCLQFVAECYVCLLPFWTFLSFSRALVVINLQQLLFTESLKGKKTKIGNWLNRKIYSFDCLCSFMVSIWGDKSLPLFHSGNSWSRQTVKSCPKMYTNTHTGHSVSSDRPSYRRTVSNRPCVPFRREEALHLYSIISFCSYPTLL